MKLLTRVMTALSAKSGANRARLIEICEEYARRFERETKRISFVPSAFREWWNDPEALRARLASSYYANGPDLLDAGRRLVEIDPASSESSRLLALILRKQEKFDEAETVLQTYMREYGENAVLTTCLAKVYAERGDQTRAERTLWRALRLDPNCDEGLEWWASIHQTPFGREGCARALEQIAAMPGSWRPQLLLADLWLETSDFLKARTYYRYVLSALAPVPLEILSRVCDRLVAGARFLDLVELVASRFDPVNHGLECGAPLMKACVETGRADQARTIANRLRATGKAEWAEQLDRWEEEITKLAVRRPAIQTEEHRPSLRLVMMTRPAAYPGR